MTNPRQYPNWGPPLICMGIDIIWHVPTHTNAGNQEGTLNGIPAGAIHEKETPRNAIQLEEAQLLHFEFQRKRRC